MPTANINSPRRWFGPADLVISGVAVLFFVYLLRAHHPNMNRLSASAMDYGVFLVLFGIPFILLGYTVRSWIRWRRAGLEETCSRSRWRISLLGSIMAAGSASLLILLQPMIDMAYRLYARQPLGIAVTIPGLEVHWVEAGVLTALAGSVCGLAGARIRRRPGLFCFILLPLWAYVSIGLLL